MNSVIYLRASTLEQSPELQLSDIRKLNPEEDYIILMENQSAWCENVPRPEFEKLKALVKKGKLNFIYIWSLDRLYRNRKRLVEFLTLCRQYKVVVVSYNQKWLSDIKNIQPPFDEIMYDLLIQIMGWLAEEESAFKSARVKMAVRKTEAGTKSHKGNAWGRKPLPQQTVNRVLKLHKMGKSIREIAKEVMIYDSNKNGRNISKSAVHKLLGLNAGEKGS